MKSYDAPWRTKEDLLPYQLMARELQLMGKNVHEWAIDDTTLNQFNELRNIAFVLFAQASKIREVYKNDNITQTKRIQSFEKHKRLRSRKT